MRVGDLRRVQKPQSLKLDLFSDFSLISSWEYGMLLTCFHLLTTLAVCGSLTIRSHPSQLLRVVYLISPNNGVQDNKEALTFQITLLFFNIPVVQNEHWK